MCSSSADRRRRLVPLLALAALLGAAGSTPGSAQTPPPPPSGGEEIPPVAIADDGSGVLRVLSATRFVLDAAYESAWRADRPSVRSGLLVVLEVRKDLVRPRQTRQPVLFAGSRPAEVMNVGFLSGRVVAIIADPVEGEPVDLARTPLFFGTAMLAERVTPERGAQELAAARSKGIAPLPAEVRAATDEARLVLPGRAALCRAAGERILLHAPDERDTAEGFIAGSP